MPADMIRIDYDAVEALVEAFRSSSNEISDLENLIDQIIGSLESGVLEGQAGEAFTMSLREALLPVVQRMTEVLNASASAIQREIDALKEAERQARTLLD